MKNRIADIAKTAAGLKARMSIGTRISAAAFFGAALLSLTILVPSSPCLSAVFGAGPKIRRGDTVAPFVTRDLEGNEINLADHLGQKAILLDFWSIYCGPCIEEMPALIDMYEKYNDMGLEIFGISLDSRFNARRLGKFVESYEHEIPYPIIHDAQAEIRRLYGIDSLPTSILVDTDGTVQVFFVGFSEAELDTAIRQILRQTRQSAEK